MPELKLTLTEDPEQYSSAAPFPHCVIDGMWPDEFLNKMIREWPDNKDECWYQASDFESSRFRNPNPSTFPPHVKAAYDYLGTPEFRTQLGELTGYSDLFLDPTCDLLEGMHYNCHGSGLGLHQDCLWNEKVQGYRVVNFFIYLNPEWKEENSGELSLYDVSKRETAVTIPPLFNRTVIMNVGSDSLHYVPPVNNMQRKSLALYYYTRNCPGPKNAKDGIRWYSFDDLSWVRGD
jgi:hypothetical protein